MDNKIDTIDNTTAVRKIKSNENDEGKDSTTPLTLITDWFVCIYIAARAGPMELPTILNILLIPIVTPEDSRGDDKRTTFIAPTAASDSPADNIPKPVEINNSDEWNSNIITKPKVVKAEPKIIGFKDPNLDMMIPDVGPNNKSTIAKGNWTLPVSMAFSPKPIGIGVCTKIGMVWKTINIERPTIIIIVLVINIWGLRKILKSINGDSARFST